MRAFNQNDRPLREILDIESAERILDDLTTEDAVLQPGAGVPQVPGYRVFHHIGGGGGGEVYFAARDGASRPCALKVIRRRGSTTAAVPPNWRELDILSQLHLSCVPNVHDYGLHNGMLYIVTDWVEGSVLGEFCRERCTTTTDRVRVFIKVARAVQLLHERGVLHRDLKPSNVLIDLHDEPVIVDFGVADVLESCGNESQSDRRFVIGSPLYMAPEQARGEMSSISTRTDVYGLAATACEILTGQTPHRLAGTPEEMIRHIGHTAARDPRSLDDTLPIPVASVIAKALAFRSGDRYPSAKEFADDLERWLRHEPVEARSYSPLARTLLFARRTPIGFAAGFAIAILTLGMVGSAGWGVSQKQLHLRSEALATQEADHKERWESEANRIHKERVDFAAHVRQTLEQVLAMGEQANETGTILERLEAFQALAGVFENEWAPTDLSEEKRSQWIDAATELYIQMALQNPDHIDTILDVFDHALDEARFHLNDN